MSRGGVVIIAGLSARVDVHGGFIETGNAVYQLVMRFVGDRVGLDHAQRAVHRQSGLGAHPVTDPAQLNAFDAADPGNLA